ncbi:MAG: glycine cleavage system aminomethyltransferase GcvT [Phycisphaerales bacterium]|nr:MAG: glycine cleavage system aminomethyltransferase GcvT [Phycisphaerales bacterium]
MLKTALHDVHEQLGARMVEFAGWRMPMLYTSIVDEHRHTRKCCSVFDVSHMGRIDLSGPDAEALVNHVLTRDVSRMAVGQCAYAHVCREDGGILDDVLASRYEDHWMIVCNASNRDKIMGWLGQHAAGRDVSIDDKTLRTSMLAIQGPRTIELLGQIMPVPLGNLKRYRFTSGEYMGLPYTISRTGYTGEDGVELILPNEIAATAYQFLRADEALCERILPAGLGARDTLRLEAAMPLYGHELNEDIDSISTGQGWCVHLETDFVGAEALRRIKEEGPKRRIVGLELAGKRIAREGWTILHDGVQVGVVTSGTMSPTLGKSIAMGCVTSGLAEPGTKLVAAPRGNTNRGEEAVLVPLPFYKAGK